MDIMITNPNTSEGSKTFKLQARCDLQTSRPLQDLEERKGGRELKEEGKRRDE